MRKNNIYYFIGVLGIVGTIYGAYTLIYQYNHNDVFHIPSLIFLIVGSVCLILFFIIATCNHFYRKKNNKATVAIEENKEEIINESTITDKEVEEQNLDTNSDEVEYEDEETDSSTDEFEYEDDEIDYDYEPVSNSTYTYSTTYVRKMGYGPVLRIEGNQILDMRTNTYYQIEGNRVNRIGSGVCYEVYGNQIKDAYGSYLFEISGNNINKTYGGNFASISGGYITVIDLSEKYEISDSLSKGQILAVVAILFDKR